MTPAVEVLGAEKTYPNGTQALRPVTLAVGEGEFVTLLGPSGCGKSTLLKLLAGLLPASGGRLLLWGRPVDELARGGHRLGFVFQDATLMPWARVQANVRLPLDLAGMPAAQSAPRVQAALQLVGLGGFGQALPRELSGGMQMRVSIARSLVTEPQLLLMDEPFGALDHQTRELMQELLLGIWEAQRKTVLFVTHDIDEAIFMANRVAVFSARPGRIKTELAVELPHPRHYTIKTSPEFMGLKARLTEEIRAESMAADLH